MKSLRGIFYSLYLFFACLCVAIRADDFHGLLHLCVQGDISSKTFLSLKRSLKELEKTSCTPLLLSTCIKDAFPVIEAVSVNYLSKKNKAVTVSMSTPSFIINQKYVLTSTGKLVDVDNFTPQQRLSLPTFTVAEEKPRALFLDGYRKFIGRCSSDLCERFSVTWYDPTIIALHDKNDFRFILIADEQTEFLPSLLEQCTHIQKIISSRAKSTGIKWCLDVRFKDQIILFSVRGNGHEKGFYEQIAYRN